MNLIPAAPGTTGDGLATCAQCGRGVDPADMCELPGNTDTCQDCAEFEVTCTECGDATPYAAMNANGVCDLCAHELATTRPHAA